MELFWELLKIILPSVVVFLTAYFVIKSFLENEQKKHLLTLKLKNKEMITPLQLQAYERLTLLLERISFENLIPRTPGKKFTAYEYQNLLTQSIRQEFDHNLSQQLYVSPETWEWIKNAKEEMISVINSSAAKVKNDAPAIELSAVIFENALKVDKTTRQKAIEILKKEFKTLV